MNTTVYDPAKLSDLLLSQGTQEITVYLPPLYIFSPGIRVYRAEDVIPFKGFISNVALGGFEEGFQPQVQLTITRSEE